MPKGGITNHERLYSYCFTERSLKIRDVFFDTACKSPACDGRYLTKCFCLGGSATGAVKELIGVQLLIPGFGRVLPYFSHSLAKMLMPASVLSGEKTADVFAVKKFVKGAIQGHADGFRITLWSKPGRKADGEIATFSVAHVTSLVPLGKKPPCFQDPATKVAVKLVPPGERNFRQQMPNWPVIHVARHVGMPILAGPNAAHVRRTQYPFRYHIAATAHRMMGCNAPEGVVVQVSENRQFRLWEREQLMVMISRCPRLDLVGFVAECKQSTLRVISRILMKDGIFQLAIANRLRQLNIGQQQIVQLDRPVFFPSGAVIPSAQHGFVYHIISQRKFAKSYVGQTRRPPQVRLRQHNTGITNYY